MPKIELKAVQRELEQGILWPFYWIYGPERLKSKELSKRIRQAVFGKENSGTSWNEEIFDGNESDAAEILDAALSPSFGGGVRLIWVRDAHLLKNLDQFTELLGPAKKLSELTSVCVCTAKDLDARKKFSKVLTEKAAVVACEEVPENQRESWVQYLAKRRGLQLNQDLAVRLCTLDPWSLDIIDQELEKFSLAGFSSDVILEGLDSAGNTQKFLNEFFARNKAGALSQVSYFADFPDESLPLLGLMGWNARQLALFISDQKNGTRYCKLNPYIADRMAQWGKVWKLDEVIDLQKELLDLDLSMKQTPLMPLGLWGSLVARFC